MYAYFKKLDYFSTECIYSPFAYRGFAREYLKDLEATRSSSIIGSFAYSMLRLLVCTVTLESSDDCLVDHRYHQISRILCCCRCGRQRISSRR